MGVTYKLKSEIVEAIVKKKNDNPKMGCRKIAEEISLVFDVKVSKSSVNSVLKEANLSSSVGRRSNDDMQKKFTIPTDKKKQLQDNVQKMGLVSSLKDDSAERIRPTLPETPSILDVPSPLEKKPDQGQDFEEVQTPPKEPYQPDSTTISSDGSQVSKKRQTIANGWSDAEVKLKDIFTYLTFSSFGGSDYLIEFIEKITGNECSKDEHKALSIWFDFMAFGIKSVEGINQNKDHFIWTLYSNEAKRMDFYGNILADMIKKIEQIHIREEDTAGFMGKMSLMNTFAKGYEVDFSSGKTAFFDPQISIISSEGLGNVTREPLDYALNYLSRELISGQKPILMFSNPFNDNSLESFYYWVQFLNDPSIDTVVGVKVLDEQSQAIGLYDIFVHVKRDFFVGLYPGSADYDRLVKDDKWSTKAEYYDAASDNEFLIGESNVAKSDQGELGGQMDLRLISIEQKGETGLRFAILTNNYSQKSVEITAQYFNKFSYLRINNKYLNKKEKNFYITSTKDRSETLNNFSFELARNNENLELSQIFDVYFRQIELLAADQFAYTQENKINASPLFSNICDILGEYQFFENHVLVRPKIPSGNHNSEALLLAIQSFPSPVLASKNDLKISFLDSK